MASFAGLPVKPSGQLFDKNLRLSTLCYADPKYGKTRLGATLNKLTKEALGKPTLYVMCEAGEGGGAASIQEENVDCIFPSTKEDMDKILSQLTSDTEYGGVVLDSTTEMVNRIIKPWMLSKTNSKEASNVTIKQARDLGVPARDDYQKINECMRDWLNRLVNLSTPTKLVDGVQVPDLDRAKHVFATAHKRIKLDKDGVITSIHPDLPGQLALSACGIFQTVCSIERTRIKEGGKSIVETKLITESNLPMVLGDRLGLIANNSPIDFYDIYTNQILPKIGETN